MVETGRRGADPLEGEERGHLVHRHPLAVLARRPAEEGEEVDERLGEEPLRAELLGAGGAVALGELLSVGAEDHPEVRERRRLGAERAEEGDVLRRVREVVDAADDVGDPHRHVVDADREVVERVAVRAHQDEVVEGPGRELGAPLGRRRRRRSARRASSGG